MTEALKKWIAPKDFYKKVFLISVPLALQQLLNSAMGIADSMMVSWIGQVTAVGTAAQIENLMMTVGFGRRQWRGDLHVAVLRQAGFEK